MRKCFHFTLALAKLNTAQGLGIHCCYLMVNKKHRRRFRGFKKILKMPLNVASIAWRELGDALEQILSFIGIKRWRKHHRNRDFDRAGRETPQIESFDGRAASDLQKADKIRDREIIKQVRYENRTLRRKSKEAESLRQEMESDSLSVSQGSAISHLAKVNQLQAEKEKQRRTREKENKKEDEA